MGHAGTEISPAIGLLLHHHVLLALADAQRTAGGALRALEIEAEVIFKATKVDGIYSADPVKYPDATRFEKISYQDVLEKQLKVMDTSAISLCMDNGLPIMVFNMKVEGNILKAVTGDLSIGTLVTMGDTAAGMI